MALPIKFKTEVSNKLKDKELADKVKNAKKSKPKSKNNIIDVIENIRQDVEKHLGEFRDNYQFITDKQTFMNYIEKANKFGIVALDTETLGLNPITDGIVGLSMYFPGEKATYVPINHYNYFSDVRLEDQMTETDVKDVLSKLTAKVIFHNAQFDIRVVKHHIGHRLPAFWDTMIAGQILNENEPHGLKFMHGKYISESDEQTFSGLFGNTLFKYIPIEYAYLYAAHDAIDTYELYEYQKPLLDSKEQDIVDLNWLYRNIEIPMIDVIVDLEDIGVAIDTEYLATLHEKYTNNLVKALDKCINEISDYMPSIEKYNASHINNPFKLPPNIGSSKQLAILFYDILNCKPVNKKSATCTDVDVMQVFAKKYPIAKYILEYRAAQKITSTYVDNIPGIMHTDGRVHTHFNSNGAKTGRMSSSNPLNLQNIPSHNEDIRKMFTGQTTIREVELRDDNAYVFDKCEEIELHDGTWQWVEKVTAGDTLNNGEIVKAVKVKDFKVLIVV